MKPKVPWTKSMLDKFLEEALLTEDEERILRTRIAGWSIVKQSIEFGMSTAAVSRIIKSIKTKYIALQPKFPEHFPPLKPSKYEQALDALTIQEYEKSQCLLEGFRTACGKDIRTMSADEIIACQKTCSYKTFYITK